MRLRNLPDTDDVGSAPQGQDFSEARAHTLRDAFCMNTQPMSYPPPESTTPFDETPPSSGPASKLSRLRSLAAGSWPSPTPERLRRRSTDPQRSRTKPVPMAPAAR